MKSKQYTGVNTVKLSLCGHRKARGSRDRYQQIVFANVRWLRRPGPCHWQPGSEAVTVRQADSEGSPRLRSS